MAWKRSATDAGWEAEESTLAKRVASSGSGETLCVKLLLSDMESRCLNKRVLQEIRDGTSAQLKLSGQGSYYPGSELQELNIQGPSQEVILTAAVHALSQISEVVGSLTSDGPDLDGGGARVKLAVPARAAAAIIGPKGEAVKQLKMLTGISCSIDLQTVPPGIRDDLAEQAVVLLGPLSEMHIALSTVSNHVTQLAVEHWYPRWVAHSYAGIIFPGFQLFSDKGKGKGKSKEGKEGKDSRGGHDLGAADAAAAFAAAAAAAAAGGADGDLQFHDFGNMPSLPSASQILGVSPAGANGDVVTPKGLASVVAGPGQAPLTLKLLVDLQEMMKIKSDAVEAQTSAQLMVSGGSHVFYPGTQLQEIVIQGGSEEVVLAGAVSALGMIAESSKNGSITSGEPSVEPQGVRIHLVLPMKAAKAVIGVRGATVQNIRQQTAMHVHVEQSTIPPGSVTDLTEQVVSLNGPLSGLPLALALISQQVAQYIDEPWYPAWTANSHVGTVIPGLSLFADTKGKGKGKSKDNGAGWDGWSAGQGGNGGDWGSSSGWDSGWDNSAAGGGLAGFGPPGEKGASGKMGLKLLVSPTEASCIVGQGGKSIREIGQTTYTKLTLSNRDNFYPGTQLQELRVLGSCAETVISAVMLALAQVSQAMGCISGGDDSVNAGESRVKVIVPSDATRIIIGKNGLNVKQLREESGLFVHVEETVIPPGPPSEISEQVVCLSGPITGLQVALPMLAGWVGELAGTPAFATWAQCSHAGLQCPGLELFQNVKGHKGKGAKGDSKGSDVKGKGSSVIEPGTSMSSIVTKILATAEPSRMPPGGFMATKLLISEEEAAAVQGSGGSFLSDMQTNTGCRFILSDLAYPGSNLRELAVQGAATDVLLAAIMQIVERISAVLGNITCGETYIEHGGSRLKMVIPSKAATGVIGPHGTAVKEMRTRCGVGLSVDQALIPCGNPDISEQGVHIRGPISGVALALHSILGQIEEICGEPWFPMWAAHSNAGALRPGFVLFADKGKGKGKDKGFGKDFAGKGLTEQWLA